MKIGGYRKQLTFFDDAVVSVRIQPQLSSSPSPDSILFLKDKGLFFSSSYFEMIKVFVLFSCWSSQNFKKQEEMNNTKFSIMMSQMGLVRSLQMEILDIYL